MKEDFYEAIFKRKLKLLKQKTKIKEFKNLKKRGMLIFQTEMLLSIHGK